MLWDQLASLVAQMVKRLPAVRETWVQSLSWEDPLEEEVATYCLENSGAEEPGGLQSAAAASLQSCPNLCNPIDGSPPGSPVPGILQARTLEWVAISFSNA